MRNLAAELGPYKFDWWPDWRGKSVAIIASGPSTKSMQLGFLRGLKVIAIKENYELYPDADVVYGCDGPWWFFRDGLQKFKGLKLCYDDRARAHYKDLHEVKIDRERNEILLDEPCLVGNGKNSGFQALNLAVQFGASRILLVGYDMNESSPDHWYGRNNWNGANNPEPWRMGLWRSYIEKAYGDLKEIDVQVFNASPISAIKHVPKISIEEFASWGLEISSSRQDSRKAQRLEANA